MAENKIEENEIVSAEETAAAEEALAAVGEKSAGETAVEAAAAEEPAAAPAAEEVPANAEAEVEAEAEPEAAAAEVPETPEVQVDMGAEQLGVEDKPADVDSERHRQRAMVEAAVYVAEEPIAPAQIAQALNLTKELVESLLAELVEAYGAAYHGIAIREVAGGFKMSTKPEFHEDIRSFVKKLKPALKLSLAALETLAVVAYKQPITGPEIMEIRGVQGGGVLKTLLERKLITAAGRKQVVGKPVLYKTTKDFLLQFGLKDLAELPTLKEFEEWSRLALGDDAGETPAEAPKEPETPAAASAAEPEAAPPAAEPETAAPAEPETAEAVAGSE
ncbi:MAG: SMC-Scp complex subunit ScpB [Bryobacterales bacterium]|nr:SMC-Scp complex subunit ScpB [Bryobacterales bacterium]